MREIRLVAHVARHTWGFHRQWIGLTRADVARITGYDEGNAQKATKRLVANGVLLCHKEPGKTNRFALPVALTARQKDGAVDVAGPDEITLSHPDKKAGGSPRFFVGPDDSFFPNENNGIHADFRGLKKGSKERSKKISLSPSPSWQAYLAEQPSKERERISGIYFKLRAQYPDDLAVLDHAPDLAAQWGVPDGQPIRNLSALLGKSWPQVRDFWREKISTKINRELAQKQREQALLDARAEEETETRLIQETFAARYPQPTEQKEVLKRYSNGTFDVDTYAGRLAAMMRWWMQSGH